MADQRVRATSAAFSVPEFRVLWAAGLASTVGDQLARVALTILVFQRTGSAALSAGTYALSMLPALVSGTLLSWLADRFPRRRVMVTCDAFRAVLVAVMAVPAVPLPAVASLLVLVQLAEVPFSAAQGAVLPGLLGPRYEAGQTVQQITNQLSLVVGFAVAATAVAALGAHAALAIDAATFALSAIVIQFGIAAYPAPHRAETGARPQWQRTWGEVSAGAVVVARDPRLRTLVWLGWLALFTVVPEGLAVPFAQQIGVSSGWIGAILAAEPAGAVVGGLLLRCPLTCGPLRHSQQQVLALAASVSCLFAVLTQAVRDRSRPDLGILAN